MIYRTIDKPEFVKLRFDLVLVGGRGGGGGASEGVKSNSSGEERTTNFITLSNLVQVDNVTRLHSFSPPSTNIA